MEGQGRPRCKCEGHGGSAEALDVIMSALEADRATIPPMQEREGL